MKRFQIKLAIKNKIYLAGGLAVIVIAALIYFIVLPYVDDVKQINTEINEVLADIISPAGAETVNPTKQISSVNEELENYSILINKNDALEFIDELEELGKTHNLQQTIDLENVNGVSGQETINTISLELSIQGGFNDIIDFIAELEKQRTYINISYISFTPSFSAPTFNENINTSINKSIVATIQAETYWY